MSRWSQCLKVWKQWNQMLWHWSLTSPKRKWPYDIFVDSDGNLLYSDSRTKSVSKVKNRQTNELIMIRIYGWFPANLCVTSSGDILVNMYDNDQTRSKAVPYLGSTDKQATWFDEEGKILFSGNAYIEYLTENRNQDICVPYCGACAIVMVNYNQDGKLG